MSNPTAIPDDLKACQTLIVELASTVTSLHAGQTLLEQKLEEQELLIKKLTAMLYGRRSERHVSPDQQCLDFGDSPAEPELAETVAAQAEEILEDYGKRRRVKPKAKRNEQLPAHLERYEVLVDAPESEQTCAQHGDRQRIGEDRVETLEFVRPKLRVKVSVYPKYACVGHSECGVEQAARQPALIEGGRFEASVAAEVLTKKFVVHSPLYRQQDAFAGLGWTPSRSTLCAIVETCGALLAPLAAFYATRVLASPILGTDETPVTMLVPGETPGSRKARMWLYRGRDQVPYSVYDFTTSRERAGPDEFLKNYRGKLMADCYSGYQKIELRTNSRILRGACWAHARRKVFDARESNPLEATLLLGMIRELYDVEDRARSLSEAERLTLRQQESAPVMDRIGVWLSSAGARQVLPKSPLGEALGYIRNHWDALRLYLTDGAMPIDNNDVERELRMVALGRKNWLFLGSEQAGHRTATIMTVIHTAHRHNLDEWMYLTDILERLSRGDTNYEAMLADRWKAEHPQAVREFREIERRDRADMKKAQRADRRASR